MQTIKPLTHLEANVIDTFKLCGLERTIEVTRAPEKVIKEILIAHDLISAPKPKASSRECLVVYELLVNDRVVVEAESITAAPAPSWLTIAPGIKLWANRMAEKHGFERYGYRYRLYRAPRRCE